MKTFREEVLEYLEEMLEDTSKESRSFVASDKPIDIFMKGRTSGEYSAFRAVIEFIKKIPLCPKCNKEMRPAYDEIAQKLTGYQYVCDCSPDLFLSVG